MAMNQSVWGPAVRAAVQALDVADNAPITQSQLDAVWIAITGAHRTHLTDNMQVLPDGLTPLNNPVGQLVLIPSTATPGNPSTGATNALQNIEGEGRVI